MQREREVERGMPQTATTSRRAQPGGCYGIQVLVVGRQKRWREAVAGQIRCAGFQATTCDSGVDAMTVLVLGLPVDLLVIDASLQGTLCCARLALEARAVRPGLRIVLAGDGEPDDGLPEGALLVRNDLHDGTAARTVREALGHPRAA